MNWVIKALTKKIISALPGKERLNYYLQKHITHSLPLSEKGLLDDIDTAAKHILHFVEHKNISSLGDMRLFEFGAGYDLHIPLFFAAIGIGRQTVVDLYPVFRKELFGHTAKHLLNNRKSIESKYGFTLSESILEKAMGGGNLRDFNIDYKVPVDMTKENPALESNSFDLITSTSVLEHIPENDIRKIVSGECFRILKPGGCISCAINMEDHFVAGDSSISVYNFLKYSDFQWQFFNSSFFYQNRLRAGDYLNLFKQTNFEIIKVEKIYPRNGDLDSLYKLKLYKRFQNRDLMEDIGIRYLNLLCYKHN